MTSYAEYPEVFCDFNDRTTENGFLLRPRSVSDLEKLGLTLEQAVGRRFTFYGGAD